MNKNDVTGYGKYFDNIYKELDTLWTKHLPKIIVWFRKEVPRGKEPSYVKKHNKLIDLHWKSSGMWKKGDRK